MALKDASSFGFSTTGTDYVTYGQFTGSSTSFTVQTGGPLGDNYLSLTAGGHFYRPIPGGPYTSGFVGWRSRATYVNGDSPTVILQSSGATAQLTVTFNTNTGVVSLNAGATVLGSTAAGAIASGGWNYFELGFTIATGTGGSAQLKINGATVINATGVNTSPDGTNVNVNYFGANVVSGSGGGDLLALTHYYFCDATGSAPQNTFLGPVRVQALNPASNDVVQFTANGLASNWQNAAQVPPSSADYNSDATVGDQDTFNCGTMAASLTTVFGVVVKALAASSDAGARSAQTVLKSGSITDVGTSTALGTTGALLQSVYQTDPNTSAQWTAAAVNAAKPGYKVSA